jgi:hypothetical protein
MTAFVCKPFRLDLRGKDPTVAEGDVVQGAAVSHPVAVEDGRPPRV